MSVVAVVVLGFVALVVWQQVIARSLRGGPRRDIARRLLNLVPLSALVALVPESPSTVMSLGIATALSLAAATLLWLGRVHYIAEAADLARAGIPPLGGFDATKFGLSMIIGPIVQEPIYRVAMLWPLARALGPEAAISLTSLLFVLEHRLHYVSSEWFQRVDYARQFALALVLGATSLASGSVAPALLGHFAYNIPPLLLLVARYRGAHATHLEPA